MYPSPLSNTQRCLHPTQQKSIKWHQLLSLPPPLPLHPPHLIPIKENRLNLNTVHFFCLQSFICLLGVVFLYCFFFLVIRNLDIINLKKIYIQFNYSLNGVLLISGSTDKTSQKALELKAMDSCYKPSKMY